MTIRKKGRRPITVNKVQYVWFANPDGDGNVSVTISLPNGGQLLNAMIHIISDQGILIITNYIVRQIILYGLKKGWTPTENRKVMRMFRFQNLDTSKATFVGNANNE